MKKILILLILSLSTSASAQIIAPASVDLPVPVISVDSITTNLVSGIVIKNSTVATAGVTVRDSPFILLRGSGWISGAAKTCDTLIGYEAATANGIDSRPGGSLKFYSNCTGDSTPQQTFQLSNNGNALSTSGFDAGYGHELGIAGFIQGDISASYNGSIYWRGQSSISPTRAVLNSSARGLFTVYESNQGVSRVEFNIGTAKPTVTTCGTGAIGATATNVIGSFTTTGATSCTLTFGAPNWSSTPICLALDVSTGKVATVTALSASAYTFSNFTSGATIFYMCLRPA